VPRLQDFILLNQTSFCGQKILIVSFSVTTQMWGQTTSVSLHIFFRSPFMITQTFLIPCHITYAVATRSLHEPIQKIVSYYSNRSVTKIKLSRHNHAGTKGDKRYSSYSVLTSALDRGGQRHAPATLYPRQLPRYLLDRRLGGPQSWSVQRLEEKSFASAGDRTPIVQSLVRYYTDWATPGL
jgi:hypothetical protein